MHFCPDDPDPWGKACGDTDWQDAEAVMATIDKLGGTATGLVVPRWELVVKRRDRIAAAGTERGEAVGFGRGYADPAGRAFLVDALSSARPHRPPRLPCSPNTNAATSRVASAAAASTPATA